MDTIIHVILKFHPTDAHPPWTLILVPDVLNSSVIVSRVLEKGSSDDNESDSEKEEQELWEETQIGKGVKRRPGEQVGTHFQ